MEDAQSGWMEWTTAEGDWGGSGRLQGVYECVKEGSMDQTKVMDLRWTEDGSRIPAGTDEADG